MATAKIDVDDTRKCFIITGDVEEILSDVAIHSYLRSYLSADLGQTDSIIIPFSEEKQESVLAKIRKLLSRYEIAEEHSATVGEVMHEYLQEEQNFEEFAGKAERIRNNECNVQEFADFTNTLKQNLPNRTLYPLQLLSAYHLAFAQNACNFSVPGSGKTSIVYGAFSYLKSLPQEHPKHVDYLFIIGPLSSFGPWEDEYQACFGRKAQSQRLHGFVPRKERVNHLYSQSPSEITLMAYQGVPKMLEELKSFLRRNRVMIVLDEAHKIKNTDGGVIAESALSLARLCNSRVVLTGTPLPNGFQDLYNLYKFIWPTKDIIRFHLFQLEQMSENLLDPRIKQLIDYISPFYIRIKKSDLKIPPPIEHPIVSVPMGLIQRQIYEYIEGAYMDVLMKDGDAGFAFRNSLAKARLIRLMQAATNPALLERPLDQYFAEQGMSDNIMIDDSEIVGFIRSYRQQEVPEKFKAVERKVKEILDAGGRVVIWTTFVQNILDLSKYLEEKGYLNKVIYGAIPVDLDENDAESETREKIIKEFHNEDCAFKILIANPFSVAESISLHKACHNAIYLERTFNAGHFIQSKDRIHRYGLKPDDVTNYYYIVSEDSIDGTIHDRLRFKERRMNEAIESQPIPLFFNVDNQDVADDDIKAVIKDYVERHN